MIEEDSFVELAKTCVRTCHVLKTATDGRDVDGLSGPNRRQIEDLGRYVDSANSPLLKMTSNISTVRHIESAIRERANCARGSQEYYPESINGCPVGWRMELLERLRTLDVCGFQPAVYTPSKRPQGDLGPDSILEASPVEQHAKRPVDAELLTPASAVCSYSVISAPRSLLIIRSPQTTSTLSPDRELDTLAPAKSLPSDERALHRLISGPRPQSELASLIEAVFSSREAIGLADSLQESEAQAFIDVLHEVRFHLPSPRNGLIDVVADFPNLDRLWGTSTLRQRSERSV